MFRQLLFCLGESNLEIDTKCTQDGVTNLRFYVGVGVTGDTIKKMWSCYFGWQISSTLQYFKSVAECGGCTTANPQLQPWHGSAHVALAIRGVPMWYCLWLSVSLNVSVRFHEASWIPVYMYVLFFLHTIQIDQCVMRAFPIFLCMRVCVCTVWTDVKLRWRLIYILKIIL